MRLDDRKKLVKWMEGQIAKLEALPQAELIKENIERLRKVKTAQEYFIEAAERHRNQRLPDMRETVAGGRGDLRDMQEIDNNGGAG
ncbi:MAG: hypothetical protein ABIG11_00920 [bacterium]